MKNLVLGVCLFALTAFGQSVELARDGKATADIVVGENGGRVAQEAAADLRAHLKQITGADFLLLKESQAGAGPRPLIVVGAGKLAAAAGIDPAKLPLEGYIIRTAPGRLFIVGSDKSTLDRGAWYGVTDLLEKDLGVRWLWPGELGAVVPRRRTLAVGPLDRADAPAIHMRTIRDGLSNANPKKLGRGMSELEMEPDKHARMVEASRYWTGHMRLGRSFQAAYGHGFTTWWGAYHDSHPEYFAMMPDGSRQWPWKTSTA